MCLHSHAHACTQMHSHSCICFCTHACAHIHAHTHTTIIINNFNVNPTLFLNTLEIFLSSAFCMNSHLQTGGYTVEESDWHNAGQESEGEDTCPGKLPQFSSISLLGSWSKGTAGCIQGGFLPELDWADLHWHTLSHVFSDFSGVYYLTDVDNQDESWKGFEGGNGKGDDDILTSYF